MKMMRQSRSDILPSLYQTLLSFFYQNSNNKKKVDDANSEVNCRLKAVVLNTHPWRDIVVLVL